MINFRRVLLVLTLLLGGFYSFPPYAAQASYYFFTHLDELNAMDVDFKQSEEQTWNYRNFKLAPIFKTKDGSRLYFIGSLVRFGTQYDIAFISAGRKRDICTPYLIYTVKQFDCNIPLSNGWVINYSSADANTLKQNL